MSLIGWLTALVSDTTMALVEHGAFLGPRESDMGNPGLEGLPVDIYESGIISIMSHTLSLVRD